MKTLSIAALLIFAFFQTTPAGATVYEYDWVTPSPTGYSGKIFLDAPSSILAPHGGTIADVIAGSYVATPYGTFSIFDSGAQSTFDGFPFSWNSSQIDLIELFLDPVSPMILPGYSAPAVALARADTYDSLGNVINDNSIEIGALQNGGYLVLFNFNPPYLDTSGKWLAVPEPSTVSLLAFATAVLFRNRLHRRRFENRV